MFIMFGRTAALKMPENVD